VVSFVAGQCKGLSEQNWAGLAGHGRTLVIYMGLANADPIADKLMADGLAPDTPVAVVETPRAPRCGCCAGLWRGWANWSKNKVVSPALIVIGAVTALQITQSPWR
jgi:uroporphyrin-III C-methyltransferase